jgi:hypothetical protein
LVLAIEHFVFTMATEAVPELQAKPTPVMTFPPEFFAVNCC